MNNFHLYEILGVEPDATPEEIKAAWRKLAQKHHPDRSGGDAAKFTVVQAAYDVLSVPERRAKYDSTGETAEEPDRVQQAAMRMLGELLDAGLGQLNPGTTDLIKWMRQQLGQVKQVMLAQRQGFEQLITNCDAATKRMRRKTDKAGENYLGGITQSIREGTVEKRTKLDADLAALELALQIIGAYDYDMPVDAAERQRRQQLINSAYTQLHSGATGSGSGYEVFPNNT